MTAHRILVITAGIGQPSATRLLGDRIATAAVRAIETAGGSAEVQVIEVREYARDLASQATSTFAAPRLATALRAVAEADAVVAVAPIFHGSYSGLFKLFVDALEADALAGTPVVIAATAGTARHTLALEHALRPLFVQLRATVLPTGVFAAAEDWASAGDLARRIDRAGAELADQLSRAGHTATPDTEVGGFERLLALHNGVAKAV